MQRRAVQSPLPGLCALCCGHSLRFAPFSCPHMVRYRRIHDGAAWSWRTPRFGTTPQRHIPRDTVHGCNVKPSETDWSRSFAFAVTLFAVVGARPHLCTCYWRGAAARLPRSAGQRRLPCAKPNRHTIPQDTIPKCGIAAAARTRSTGGAYTPAGISSYPAASGDTGRRLKEMQRYAMVATMCALRHADSKLGHTLFCAVQPDERAYLQT